MEPEQQARDWKKLFLVGGLGILSWVATYVGMLELIEANMGDLPLVHKVIIGFSVAMLMTMIIWLLDQMFSPIGLFARTLYAAGYLFLTVISVGFGFGFYWKVLESRSEASRSAESAVGQVQGSLYAASTRLDQLQSTLDNLTTVSRQKAETERASGTTCPGSKPGDGPRRKLREDDAARFSFAADFVKARAGQVKTDMSGLDVDLAKIAKDDKSTIDAKSGTRNEFMKGLGRKLDLTVTGFNAFRTDPQLKQIRADLAERADKTLFPDTKGGTYSCPDPQLQTALKGVVRAIEQLPEIEKPKIAAVEGSEATIEAFRRLTATFYGLLSFKMPPSAEDLRALQQKAVQSVEGAQAAQRAVNMEQAGLSKRDYVPLAIAIFVDICLLLVSMGRPMNRLQSLVPKMREAERGPVYQILSRFSDIHADPDIRQKFEIFRHVVFDFHGDYYVAIPLDAPPRANPAERRELQLEAHLLANLFASFEQEKIFGRVYAPLLSTKAIQKKLWRQGSKFAHSEAFRIYKFKDGAWSDIILGAVMGAARRVESDKRRRREEEEAHHASAAARHDEPEFTHAPTPAPNVLPFPHAATAYRSGPWAPYPPAGAPGYVPQPHSQPTARAAAPELQAAFGEYARFQEEQELRGRAGRNGDPGTSSAQFTAPPAFSTPAPEASMEAIAATGATTGPASAAVGSAGVARRIEEPTAPVSELPATAANSNTAPPLRVEPATVMTVIEPQRGRPMPPPLPVARIAEPVQAEPRDPEPAAATVPIHASRPDETSGIGVELRERTVRFTVPNTSPAVLPAALQARLGGSLGPVAAAAVAIITEAAQSPVQPPPRPPLPIADAANGSEVLDLGDHDDATGEHIDVHAIARSFAAASGTK